MASIGAVILWFGWYGFNPGSTLSAMDWEGIGRVAGNTTLAACAGGMVAVLFVYPRSKKWDLGMSLNGFLGGLVAITAPCYWVNPLGAVLIGAIAGIIVPLVGQGAPMGTLGVYHCAERTFTQTEADFVTAAAHILAGAMERDRELRANRHAARHDALATQSHQLRHVARHRTGIAGHHLHHDPRPPAVGHGAFGLRPQRVDQADERQELHPGELRFDV